MKITKGLTFTDRLGNRYRVADVYNIVGGPHCHLDINELPVNDLHGYRELVPARDIEGLMSWRDVRLIEQYVTRRPKNMRDALRMNQERFGTVYVATR